MTKALEHPLTLIVAAVLFSVLFFSLRQTGNKSQQSTNEISLLEEKAYKTSKEVQELQEELEYSKSTAYKEKIVRNELLLQKPGEYIVQMTAPQTEPLDTHITTSQPETNQEKWFEILF